MSKKRRIIPTKVKFNRDKKCPENHIDKPKKSNGFKNPRLDFNSPGSHPKYIKKTIKKATG